MIAIPIQSKPTGTRPAPAPGDLAAPPLRILLIDDDANLRSSLQQLFEHQCHQVITAATGLKALHLFSTFRNEIDVVLLDYLMPGMDGAETLRRLRQLQPRLKIVVVSGADELRLRRAMSDHLIDGYLRKPVLSQEILRLLRQVTAAPPR